MTLIDDTIEQIQAERFDYIRCSLTGAPYARLLESEIRRAIAGDILTATVNDTVDALVDSWLLRMVTYNSQPCPALRNIKTLSPEALSRSGDKGSERVITYLLGRLLFPFVKGQYHNSGSKRGMVARAVFVANMYDALAEAPEDFNVAECEYALLLGDSWMDLNDWQQSKLVTANRDVGLALARNEGVREIFKDPDKLDLNNMPMLMRFILEVTIFGTRKDAGEQRVNASSLSLDLIRAQAEALGQKPDIKMSIDAMTQHLINKDQELFEFQRELVDYQERNATAVRWKKEADQRQRRLERKAKKEQAAKARDKARFDKLSDRQKKLLNLVATFATDMIPAKVK